VKNAELIARRLAAEGVRWVFGVPSGPVLPLIEALRGAGVEFVLTTSETSAGFMATVVGQLSGTPGVCIATLGPGATNLATGLGAAWLDRAPVLALTCNVPTAWLDRRVQMRIDHHTLMEPLTKASLPLRSEALLETLDTAIAVACAEPPGPVHLDLPEDVALERFQPTDTARKPPAPNEVSAPLDTSGDLGAVRAALARSRRPLLVTGLSLTRSRALGALRQFVDTQRMPFISTLHAKGCLPESHPWWAGVLGRARRSDVQALVDRADLLLAVGFDPVEINYEEWLGQTPVVHLDREPAEGASELRFVQNGACDLDAAIGALADLPLLPTDWTPDEIAAHRSKLEAALRPAGSTLGPHDVLDVLRSALSADAILAYDVGAHTHQIATQWRTDEPLTCLSTNGWSSMGFGLPAAYAAKLVRPERTVVAVVGDGCFLMTAGELSVARRLGLNVPVVVLNDGWLGLIKVKQERKRYALEGVYLGQPPDSPAHYFGVPCRPARTPDELRSALDWALGLGGPSVIEAFVDVEPYSTTVYD
jgi:acetolactate synthase-1/2/3 large subunit